ncbi:coiled-coil domain-containing protein 105 [Monodelphis domestica]|uniref:Coiled-coil domain containing 105 n=1 Tax=Monodelphis domestica TaxID=13616 RepID=F7FKV6_MONDO|nr:coiled-coil domain-containing protein 105 [Monodelphis domestica]
MPVLLHPLEPESEDRVGAPEWRQNIRNKVNAAQQLADRCSTKAVSLWQPRDSASFPNIANKQCRKTYMAPWRFRVEMLKGGGTVEQPPPADGVTLWKEKLKPPAWKANVPLPLNRDARTIQTNEYIQNYVRGVRLLAARLRQAEQEVNSMLQTVLRQREIIDQRLSDIRKSLLINEQSRKMRSYRPSSEQIPDKVDSLVLWEKEELRTLKRRMEKDMEASETFLRALAKSRENLKTCCEERLQAVDLMNHCFDSVLLEAGRQSWIDISRLHTPKVQGTASPPVDPLGVNPPECNLALTEAKRLISDGKTMLANFVKSQNHAHIWQMHINKTVGSTLNRKMQETTQLNDRLKIMSGLLRGTIHRCNKFKHEMSITQGLNKGPLCHTHLSAREKLDRPMVRVFQRHVGTQLPEASHLSMDSEKLKHYTNKLQEDLDKLNTTRNNLTASLRNKDTGRNVDYDVLRLRIRHSHPHVSYEQAQRLSFD